MEKKKELANITIECSKEELSSALNFLKDMIVSVMKCKGKDDSDEPEPKAFQPKRGDICTHLDEDSVDAIFRYDGGNHTDEDGDIWLGGDLALTFSDDLLKPYMIIHGEGAEYLRDCCRLANEEEIKLFNEKVKEFYEVKKDTDWVARIGDVYYTPSFDYEDGIFESVKAKWTGTSMGVCTKRRGWAFRTEEECQQLCDKLNEAIKNVKP